MHRLALSAAVACAVGVVASSAAAVPPQHIVFEDDTTFQSTRYTNLCGFPVWVSFQGTVLITLRSQDGTVTEMDAFQDWSLTFSAPTNGTSFSYKFGPAIYEYPDGVYVGAPAIVTAMGVQRNVPGERAEAGRVVFEAEVAFVSPEGVPFVDVVSTVSTRGTILDTAASDATVCAALAG